MKAHDEAMSTSARILEAFEALEEREDAGILQGLLALQDGTWEKAVSFALVKLVAENKVFKRRLGN